MEYKSNKGTNSYGMIGCLLYCYSKEDREI